MEKQIAAKPELIETGPVVTEIQAKAILSKSRIHDWALNAYVGCAHNCAYCYARFMRRFTGHSEPWGRFVDVRVNAVELLEKELQKKKKGTVWISGVCDAYQPLERDYRLSGRCLEMLVDHGWPVSVQTKSPLVLRDLDTLRRAADVRVGFSIASLDERVRAVFEPGAPAIAERIEALGKLHDAGVRTFVMVAPLLPGAEGLVERLADRVDEALIDRDNYGHADRVYRKYGLQWAQGDSYLQDRGRRLQADFIRAGVRCRMLY